MSTQEQLTVLCTKCQGIFSHDPKVGQILTASQPVQTPEYYRHHVSGTDLVEAIASGCRICKILYFRMCENARHGIKRNVPWKHEVSLVGAVWYTLRTLEMEDGIAGLNGLYFLYGFEEGETPRDSVELNGREANLNTLSIMLHVDIGERGEGDDLSSLSVVEITEEVEMSTKSDRTWSLVLKWLGECMEHHEECSQESAAVSWYPTRLIDVGTTEDSYLRLHISKTQPPSGPYLSLSHCWGKIAIKRLLKDDLQDMVERINANDLTKTFRDAIEITRSLKVRYIWIDSLCIIQDSAEDWGKEALMMEDVYRNALLNIAASGSSDGHGGCFVARDPYLVQPVTIQSSLHGSPITYSVYDADYWSLGVTRAPLNTRAWVVQERVLSPRILHFGYKQVHWECNHKLACESFPSGLPRFDQANSTRLPARSDERLACFSPDWYGLLRPVEELREYDVWSSTVTTYSRCNLTHGSDKLIAFSGVAKQFSTLLDDEYLAGLWRRYLPYHLLWCVERPAVVRKATYSDDYRAPSWSWAACDGEIVDYPVLPGPFDESNILVEILEAECQTTTDDSTGQCIGGSIRLLAFLKPAQWQKLDGDKLHFLTFDNDDDEDGDGETERSNDDDDDDTYGGICQSMAFPDHIDISLSPEIFCMPVHSFMLDEDEWRTYGLILERSGEEENVFRRIGQFKSDFDDCRLFADAMLHLQEIVII